jgi:hypothetical protein
VCNLRTAEASLGRRRRDAAANIGMQHL